MTAALENRHRIRSAFREAALGLMEWEDPPEPELHRDVQRYLAFTDAVCANREERP